MGGADDTGVAVREQHRGAVGGQDGEAVAGAVGHHRIRSRPGVAPGSGDHFGPVAVHLMHRDQFLDPQMRRDPRPVLGHRLGDIHRSFPAVQPGVDTGRDPALAGEETVVDAVEAVGKDWVQAHVVS
jgi:hypothetical protein